MYNLKFFLYPFFHLLFIFNILMLYKLAYYMKYIKFSFRFYKSASFMMLGLVPIIKNNGYTMEMSIEGTDLGQEENSTYHV